MLGLFHTVFFFQSFFAGPSKMFQNPFAENLFGYKKTSGLSLRQFLSHHLSRKAEGNGPMMPWQPVVLHAAK
jgi:hypothetical protein